ncbi:MAG: amino acid permease [Bacteroidia bacterium]|nr:amino acid permease [Bacteroidia bacterium]
MASTLFKTKSIEQLKAEAGGSEGGMKRTLNAFNLTTLGIGAIIGAGIFSLVGTASQAAGPAVILSFVLAALACAFAGLCYAEFAAMIPVAGSAYVYAFATLGEIVAFVIGWALTLEYAFGASTVAVSWSGYLVSFLRDFQIVIPAELTNAAGVKLIDLTNPELAQQLGVKPAWVPIAQVAATAKNAGIDLAGLSTTTALFNLPAVIIIGVLSAVLYRGISESAKLNNVIVVIKMVVILAFIGAGVWFVDHMFFTPFIPANPNEWGSFNPESPELGGFGHLGWTGILAGAGTIFFAYIGFDAVSTAAQETKRPERNMPIGILASLVICTVIYILVAYVLIGLVPYTSLNVPDPIAVGINAVQELNWLKYPIKLGALAGLTSVMLVMMLGQSRIFYSMGNDGLLPGSFSRLHPKFKSPVIPTIITGIFAATLAGLLPIGTLGHLVSLGTLLAFAIVCIGILVLRYTKPNLERPFRTPLVPLVPVLGALISLLLIVGLEKLALFAGIGWLVIGVAIYFAWGRGNRQKRMARQ